jgi:anthranilate synthase component I
MKSVPVIRPVRLEPSSLLALHAALSAQYPVLLESAAAGTALGRFDILFAYPQESLSLRSDGTLLGRDGSASVGSFLMALDSWWHDLRQSPADTNLPFRGGWFVYLGYELAAQIEPRLVLRTTPSGLIATAMRIPAAVVFEHDTGNAWIVAEGEFAKLADLIEADIAQLAADNHDPSIVIDGPVIEEPASEYINAVRRTLNYIGRGDIYQANLSRAWRGQLQTGIAPHHIYRRLRQTNPGPFCALAVLPELAIVSSSPERLVSVEKGWISTRPIAGTRPRGIDERADAELVSELQAHPKERAEHVMLIDLERNDLGRVCLPGTVEVDEYMTIETYAHVHHIVSNVRGQLRPDVGPGEALAAVFPGGTITGCPKVRCMEIIAELEDTARGAYTGSLGYLNLDGSMDFNILIRSIEIRGNEFSLRAGAGIVADSIPERELDESRAKARGVLRALTSGAA